MKSPFPYFGGKSKIAADVWARFGKVKNYVEPFFGSGAILLSRPGVDLDNLPLETVNDKDGLLANFWRAVTIDAEAVVQHADWPVNENDLHARHVWLVNNRENITRKLEGNPEWFDAHAAGWWVWGISSWIGSGWCNGGNGKWNTVNGELVEAENGVKRQRPDLGDKGRGVHRKNGTLYDYFAELQARIRRVRVCSGDWSRVCGRSVTYNSHGLTAVFLDPPYAAEADRCNELYAKEDLSVSHNVRKWAIENGDNPLMRIALCGYAAEHEAEIPETWERFAWKTDGGYGKLGKQTDRGKVNRSREMVWFSPHCLNPTKQKNLF